MSTAARADHVHGDDSVSITGACCAAFTTSTETGGPKTTLAWIADLARSTFGFVTPATSASGPRVRMQHTDTRNRLPDGSQPVTGTAVLSAAESERVNHASAEKYGWRRTVVGVVAMVSTLFGTSARVSDAAAVVTPG